MTLAFSTHINKKPTEFVSKIYKGFITEDISVTDKNDALIYRRELDELDLISATRVTTVHPKIHSIREDKTNRWTAGNKIHFVLFNRTPNRLQFAPVLDVKCVQTIHMMNQHFCPVVFIDDRILSRAEVECLARNDGFDSVADFFGYFNYPFTGKIINWTNHKY